MPRPRGSTDPQALHDPAGGFEGFVRSHQAPLRAWLRRLVHGDTALADDLAQEAFLRAYRGMHTYRGEASPRTWLSRIALSAWRDHQRSHSVWTTPSSTLDNRDDPSHLTNDAAPDSAAPAHAPQAGGLAEQIGLRVDVDRALARLSEVQRAVVIHACWADLSQSEIAQALGLPLGTVKTHYRRAMRLLATALEDRA